MQPSLFPVIAFLNQVETAIALSILEQEGIPATVEGYHQAVLCRNSLAIRAYVVYVSSDHFGQAAAALEDFAHAPRERTAGWWRAYRRLLGIIVLWCSVSTIPLLPSGIKNAWPSLYASFWIAVSLPIEPIGAPTIFWRKRREDEEG